jgi:hypothetical protein
VLVLPEVQVVVEVVLLREQPVLEILLVNHHQVAMVRLP